MNRDLCLKCYKESCREYGHFLTILRRRYAPDYKEAGVKFQHALYNFNLFYTAWFYKTCEQASPFIPCHYRHIFTPAEKEMYDLISVSAPFEYRGVVGGRVTYFTCLEPPERCPYALEHCVCTEEEETCACGKMEK